VADDIDSLLQARASQGGSDDIDSLLSDRANGAPVTKSSFRVPTKEEVAALDKSNAESPDLPWYKRAEMGLGDSVVGAGQVMQHVIPDEMLNSTRRLFGLKEASTQEFDKEVRSRENQYQAERSAAGQSGMDWARIGGNVANPVNWLGPSGEANSVWQAVKVGAKTGALQALMQPVTDKGNFLYDKGVQEIAGTVTGGTLGGALHGISNALSWGTNTVRKVFAGDEPAQQQAAQQVLDNTLKAAGADPAKMDPNLYSSIRQEVDDALRIGVDPDPKVMLNRADAGALPVPINLTRGQAARDASQFSWEVNTSKLRGAGEQLDQHLTDQNRRLIENLNVLGAKDAPSTFDASQKVIGKIQDVDAQMREQIGNAYQAVRDSAGRPALMDHVTFVDTANNALDHGQLGPFLPETIRKQLNDISEGKLPLSVNVAQQLDKVWSGAQRGASNDSEKAAIGALRTALNDAPITDQLGQESMQAYKAAREMARQRFAMIDANPAYKAIVDSTSKAEPDKFFQNFIQGGNASEISSLKQLIGDDGASTLQKTMVGVLKKKALGGASEENGVFSQAAYNKVLQDPVQGPRLQELFKNNPEALDQLYRVGRVAENIVAFPKNHSVNTSNTSPTLVNTVRDMAKSEAGNSLLRMLPGGKALAYVTQQAQESSAANKAVNEALSPGVTSRPLEQLAQPRQVPKLSDLLTRAGAAYGASSATNKRKKEGS
jgi:hypothetical protein